MGTWDTDKSSYTAGNFALSLDDHPVTSYLKSLDGGFVKHALVDEGIGGDLHHIKHASVAEIDPISFEFGMSGAESVLKWIQQSWNKQFMFRNGSCIHADDKYKQQIEHQFWQALITETTFPTLDGASKDPVMLKVKMQPSKVETKVAEGPKLAPGNSGKGKSKHKDWMCSAFRLSIDQIDDMRFTNKIDGFTIKQGVKKLYTGADRFPELAPTKLEFPHITGTIAMAYAKELFKWYDDYVVKGKSDAGAQKTGSIEFLSTDRKKSLFTIRLYDVGLVSLSVMPSTANADQIKRAKFELYVGRMDLDVSMIGMD